MKVKCLRNKLSEDELSKLGFRAWQKPLFQISTGAIYTALGLTAKADYIAGAVVQVCDDAKDCAFVPICLFEIVDNRPSQLWRARLLNEHALAFWPEEFYSDHFHERLADGDRGAREAFARVIRLLENE